MCWRCQWCQTHFSSVNSFFLNLLEPLESLGPGTVTWFIVSCIMLQHFHKGGICCCWWISLDWDCFHHCCTFSLGLNLSIKIALNCTSFQNKSIWFRHNYADLEPAWQDGSLCCFCLTTDNTMDGGRCVNLWANQPADVCCVLQGAGT